MEWNGMEEDFKWRWILEWMEWNGMTYLILTELKYGMEYLNGMEDGREGMEGRRGLPGPGSYGTVLESLPSGSPGYSSSKLYRRVAREKACAA